MALERVRQLERAKESMAGGQSVEPIGKGMESPNKQAQQTRAGMRGRKTAGRTKDVGRGGVDAINAADTFSTWQR